MPCCAMLSHPTITRVIVQAERRQLVTSEPRVKSSGILCVICDKRMWNFC
jgi:hypothetical protein